MQIKPIFPKKFVPDLSPEEINHIGEISEAYLPSDAAEFSEDDLLANLYELYQMTKGKEKKMSKEDAERVQGMVVGAQFPGKIKRVKNGVKKAISWHERSKYQKTNMQKFKGTVETIITEMKISRKSLQRALNKYRFGKDGKTEKISVNDFEEIYSKLDKLPYFQKKDAWDLILKVAEHAGSVDYVKKTVDLTEKEAFVTNQILLLHELGPAKHRKDTKGIEDNIKGKEFSPVYKSVLTKCVIFFADHMLKELSDKKKWDGKWAHYSQGNYKQKGDEGPLALHSILVGNLIEAFWKYRFKEGRDIGEYVRNLQKNIDTLKMQIKEGKSDAETIRKFLVESKM